MRKTVLMLIILISGTVAFAQNTDKIRVAVMDLESQGMEPATVAALSDRLRSELLNTGKFDVMERNRMELILREQGFQQTGVCSSTECMVEAGHILGVDRMIAGSVAQVGNIHTLSVQMIDIQTGRMMLSRDEDCDCPIEDVLTRSVRNIALKLAGLDPDESATPEIEDGKKRFPWLWVGVGAAIIGGGVAAIMSGGEDGGQNGSTVSTGSISVEGEW